MNEDNERKRGKVEHHMVSQPVMQSLTFLSSSLLPFSLPPSPALSFLPSFYPAANFHVRNMCGHKSPPYYRLIILTRSYTLWPNNPCWCSYSQSSYKTVASKTYEGKRRERKRERERAMTARIAGPYEGFLTRYKSSYILRRRKRGSNFSLYMNKTISEFLVFRPFAPWVTTAHPAAPKLIFLSSLLSRCFSHLWHTLRSSGKNNYPISRDYMATFLTLIHPRSPFVSLHPRIFIARP